MCVRPFSLRLQLCSCISRAKLRGTSQRAQSSSTVAFLIRLAISRLEAGDQLQINRSRLFVLLSETIGKQISITSPWTRSPEGTSGSVGFNKFKNYRNHYVTFLYFIVTPSGKIIKFYKCLTIIYFLSYNSLNRSQCRKLLTNISRPILIIQYRFLTFIYNK